MGKHTEMRGIMQRFKEIGLLFVVLVCVLGSSTARLAKIAPAGGSKSDGVVDISYQKGILQKVIVDWEEAQWLARVRCRAWGYAGAIRFGREVRKCLTRAQAGSICYQWDVTIRYQCVD